MTKKRATLSGVLNLRVDEALSREIDRITAVEAVSASEAAASSSAPASKCAFLDKWD